MTLLRRRRSIAPVLGMAVAFAATAPALAAKTAAAPRVVPVLDKAKAARAVEAYRKAINVLCDALWLTPEGKPMRPQWDPNNYDVQRSAAPHTGDEQAVAKLRALGLDRAEEIPLCEKGDADVRGLASGSFVVAGADEVLLEVWNGADALAPHTVAVMRADGKGYRLIKHLAIGNSPAGNRYEPRLRLATASRRDILFLCESGGMQGVYPTTCGFFGRGSFREPPPEHPPPATPQATAPDAAERDDELALVSVTTCGPTLSVELGKITPRADRIAVEVALVSANRVPAADEGSAYCEKETSRASKSFTIEYKFDGAIYRRLTPIPPEITDALTRN